MKSCKVLRLCLLLAIPLALYAKAALPFLPLQPMDAIAEVLHSDNFDEFVNDNERAAIILRHPGYEVFSSLGTKEFAVMSRVLQNNGKCKFGTVKIPIRPNSTPEELKPHLSFVKDGKTVDYDGPMTMAAMMGWVQHHRLCDFRVDDFDLIKLYCNHLENGYMQVYILMTPEENDDERAQAIYDDLIASGFKVPIIHTTHQAGIDYVLRKHGLELEIIKLPAIMVRRHMDHMHPIYFFWRDWTNDEKVVEYFQTQLVPTIHGTDSYLFDELMKEEKTFVYFYTKGDDLRKYIDQSWLNKLAKNNLDKFRFIYSKGNPVVEAKLNKLLVIDEEYVDSAVRAFEMHPERGEFLKYRPCSLHDGEILQQGVVEFLHDLRDGRLHHFIKTESAIPEHLDVGPVKHIVGEDFHRRIVDSEGDCLVLFYSPWCGHCHHAKRVFRDLGRRVKDSLHFTVAQFDAFNNEVEHFNITEYPVVYMFPHAHKHEPVLYQGPITIEGLAKFVERECKKAWISATSIEERHLKHERLFEHAEL